MRALIQMALGAFGTILFVLLAHKKIGSYPSPLPKSENPGRELFEALILWLTVFVLITYIVLFGAESYPSHRRDAKELGFRTPIEWKPAVALVGFGIFFGFFAFLFEGSVPTSMDKLIIGLLSPSFKEER